MSITKGEIVSLKPNASILVRPNTKHSVIINLNRLWVVRRLDMKDSTGYYWWLNNNSGDRILVKERDMVRYEDFYSYSRRGLG